MNAQYQNYEWIAKILIAVGLNNLLDDIVFSKTV